MMAVLAMITNGEYNDLKLFNQVVAEVATMITANYSDPKTYCASTHLYYRIDTVSHCQVISNDQSFQVLDYTTL